MKAPGALETAILIAAIPSPDARRACPRPPRGGRAARSAASSPVSARTVPSVAADPPNVIYLHSHDTGRHLRCASPSIPLLWPYWPVRRHARLPEHVGTTQKPCRNSTP